MARPGVAPPLTKLSVIGVRDRAANAFRHTLSSENASIDNIFGSLHGRVKISVL